LGNEEAGNQRRSPGVGQRVVADQERAMNRARMGIWVVLAVLVAAVAGALVLRPGGGGSASAGAPVPLRLGAGGTTTTVGAAASASADIAMFPYQDVTYVAAGGLPSLGGTAVVYTLAAPDDAAIGRLAHALGIDGPVTRDGDTRLVTDGTRQVSVYGTTWNVSPVDVSGAGPGTVSSGVVCATSDPAVPCPEPPPTTIPQRPDNFPSRADAIARSVAVLDDAGFDTTGATTTADDVTTAWSVVVTLPVDGHPTVGFAASFEIGPGLTIEYAGGTIGSVSALGDYPLVDTPTAIDRLNADGPFYGGGGVRPMAFAADATASSTGASTAPVAGGDSPVTTVVAPDSTSASEPIADAPTVGPDTVDPACDPAGACNEPGSPPETVVVPPDSPPATVVVPPDSPSDSAPDVTMPPLPPPAPITATLDHVTMEYAVAWSWDGTTTYVVPTYRFTGTDSDGNIVDVVALAVDGALLAGPG
jgi:hypothetical protein